MYRLPGILAAVHDQTVMQTLPEIVRDRLPVDVTAHVGLVGVKASYARRADLDPQPGRQHPILRQQIVGDVAIGVYALSVRLVVSVPVGQTGDGLVLMSLDLLAERAQLHRDGVLSVARTEAALVVPPELVHGVPEVLS